MKGRFTKRLPAGSAIGEAAGASDPPYGETGVLTDSPKPGRSVPAVPRGPPRASAPMLNINIILLWLIIQGIGSPHTVPR